MSASSGIPGIDPSVPPAGTVASSAWRVTVRAGGSTCGAVPPAAASAAATPPPPTSHPTTQPVPGPEGHVPADWQQLLR